MNARPIFQSTVARVSLSNYYAIGTPETDDQS